MSAGPKRASKTLVTEFGRKIESPLKSGKFSDYASGDEIPFINDAVDLLDGIYAYDGQQILNVKCKKAHSSPMVEFPNLTNYDKTKVELGDLLFVFNFWEDQTVIRRQAFINQSKCMKDRSPGILYWEIDESQYELLHERPKFELEHNTASEVHDLSGSVGSFFNYSFVSDVHRPFFYKTGDMQDYIDDSYTTPRFYYGRNPPNGNRYLYAVLRAGLRNQYGASFTKGDPEYTLLEEIYEHATLNQSKTANSISTYTDGGRPNGEFGIVNIDVSTDGSIINLDRHFDQDITELDDISEGLEADIAGSIRGAFAELDSDGLDFDGI